MVWKIGERRYPSAIVIACDVPSKLLSRTSIQRLGQDVVVRSYLLYSFTFNQSFAKEHVLH